MTKKKVPDFPPYIKGKEKNTLDQALDRIAEALLDGRAQFLFGAGMSRDSGLPLGEELKKILLQKFFPPSAGHTVADSEFNKLADEYPLDAVVQAVEAQPGLKREDLTKLLHENLIGENAQPNDAHHAFVSLIGFPPRVGTVFTTNYDDLLEKALGPDFARPILENDIAKIQPARDANRIPIVYLRGKLDAKYDISEKDLASARFRPLSRELETALYAAAAFVFVGYSLSDIDFRQLYLHYVDQMVMRQQSSKTTYFVSPPHSEYSYILGSEIWRLREAVWIPLSATDFFLKLKHVVENRRVHEIRVEVQEKYRVNDSGLEDLIEKTSALWQIPSDDALLFLYEARTRIGGAK